MTAPSPALRETSVDFQLDRISLMVLMAAGLVALGIIGVRLRDATTLSQLAYNEGWNAFHALRFQQTGTPYPPAGGVVMNNYTPLWFVLVAWAGAVTNSLVFAGRLVATLGFALVLACSATIGWTLRGRSGALASLITVAFVLAAEAHLYIGIADPQFLAQGVSAIGVMLAVRATDTRDPRYLWAMGISVLAGFVKYNLAALPFALLVTAMFDGRASFVRVMLVAIAATVLGYFLCALVGGMSWPAQLLSARVYSISRLFRQAIPFVTANAMGILIACAGLLTMPRGHVQRVLGFQMAAALPLALFFVGGEGVGVNIFFDTIIPMAVAASLVVGARLSIRGVGGAAPSSYPFGPSLGAIILGAFFLVIGVPQILETSIRVRHPEAFNRRAEMFRNDIQFMKSISGNAICYDLDLCYLAGKPQIYDPFNASQALTIGTISSERARALLAAEDIQVIHTWGEPLRGIPEPIASEVAAEFDVARKNENGVFYVRRKRLSKP